MKYYGCIGTGCKADSLMERIAELEADRDALMRKWSIETDESLTECVERNIDGWKQRCLRAEAERDALKAALSEGVLASHDGKVPNRQWVTVQSWLYPGDKIVLVCGDATIAAKGE